MALYTKIPGSGEGHAPIRVSADPRSGSGLAAKPGMWAYDGTNYYQATGTGVNDWVRSNEAPYQTDRDYYIARARSLMGLTPSTRLSAVTWDHFDAKFPANSNFNPTAGAGGANRAEPPESAWYIKAAAGTNSYTYLVDGSNAHWGPIPASGRFYLGTRLKWVCADQTMTYTHETWQNISDGLDRIRIRSNGAGSVVVTVSTNGVAFDTIGTVAKDDNYHVYEVANDGTNTSCYIDGAIAGTPSTKRGNAVCYGLWYHNNGTAVQSEQWCDWHLVAY